MHVPEERIDTLQFVITAAPQRSRGCAEVGGRRISIAIASPSHFSLRRLARLLEHEVSHAMGLDHEDMPERLLYSTGPTPRWALGTRLRYHGRARSSFDLLRKPRAT